MRWIEERNLSWESIRVAINHKFDRLNYASMAPSKAGKRNGQVKLARQKRATGCDGCGGGLLNSLFKDASKRGKASIFKRENFLPNKQNQAVCHYMPERMTTTLAKLKNH
ncbi:hypothetical protein T12_8417 [Trichinella patagoniensis]|uniref:Uncharacterized protein n=1 Tax=Trichinella patagoniensis TaxID=990121 RepID=A0A0V0ZZN5_9BILA|nr:hypothetical protein T12_8417 [Trichinella patagoniensis]